MFIDDKLKQIVSEAKEGNGDTLTKLVLCLFKYSGENHFDNDNVFFKKLARNLVIAVDEFNKKFKSNFGHKVFVTIFCKCYGDMDFRNEFEKYLIIAVDQYLEN